MYSTELPSILCSMVNKSLQAEIKKKKMRTGKQKPNQPRNKKPQNCWLSGIQMFFEKEEPLP